MTDGDKISQKPDEKIIMELNIVFRFWLEKNTKTLQ